MLAFLSDSNNKSNLAFSFRRSLMVNASSPLYSSIRTFSSTSSSSSASPATPASISDSAAYQVGTPSSLSSPASSTASTPAGGSGGGARAVLPFMPLKAIANTELLKRRAQSDVMAFVDPQYKATLTVCILFSVHIFYSDKMKSERALGSIDI